MVDKEGSKAHAWGNLQRNLKTCRQQENIKMVNKLTIKRVMREMREPARKPEKLQVLDENTLHAEENIIARETREPAGN